LTDAADREMNAAWASVRKCPPREALAGELGRDSRGGGRVVEVSNDMPCGVEPDEVHRLCGTRKLGVVEIDASNERAVRRDDGGPQDLPVREGDSHIPDGCDDGADDVIRKWTSGMSKEADSVRSITAGAVDRAAASRVCRWGRCELHINAVVAVRGVGAGHDPCEAAVERSDSDKARRPVARANSARDERHHDRGRYECEESDSAFHH